MEEMTFPELTDRIEEMAQEVSDADELEEKARAAEELLGPAGYLGAHTGRYAGIAWCLDMLCFLATVLFLYGSLFPESSWPGVYSAFRGLLELLRIGDIADYLRFLLVLLTLPAAFDLVLSAICKRTLVTVGPTAAGAAGGGGSDVIERIRKALYDAQGELNPTNYLPAWTVYLVGAVVVAGAVALLHSTVTGRSGRKLLAVLGAVLLFLAICVIFVAVLWVRLFVLSLFFSSGSCKRALQELLEELPDYEEEHRRREEEREAEEAEQRRLADLKEGAELYRMATAEGDVNKILLARAAEKGDPRANLEMGKSIIENVEGLDRREAAARYQDAKKHFQIADEADLPDGILMYASARLMTEAHDTMGWLNILRRLRTVERVQVSMRLRERYTKVRDQLIERVQLAMAHSERKE